MNSIYMKILADLFSIIAMTLMFISYIEMDKRKYLFIQIFSNLFFGIQYYLLNVKTIFVSVIFFTIRALVFYNFENDKKSVPEWLYYIFMLSLLAFGLYILLILKHYNSLITVGIGLLTTYGLWQENLKTTYKISIICALLWSVYNCTIGAYFTNIINVVEITAGIIGIIEINKGRKIIKI